MSSDVWFLYSLLRRALDSTIVPRRTGPISWEWDIAGRCEMPGVREWFARPPNRRNSTVHGKTGVVFRGADEPGGVIGQPLRLIMHVPCRKCPYCLRRRAAQWRDRARYETDTSQRTWFCTLTLKPESLFRHLSMARAALSAQSTDLEEIGDAEQFQRLVWVIGRTLTKGIKRLRKNTRADIRYIVVVERHKSGVPHFHALIHEQHGSPAVKHADLVRDLWREGFCNYKLADPGSASYVTKYLTKSALSRVRASVRYGKPRLAIGPRSGAVKFDSLASDGPPF